MSLYIPVSLKIHKDYCNVIANCLRILLLTCADSIDSSGIRTHGNARMRQKCRRLVDISRFHAPFYDCTQVCKLTVQLSPRVWVTKPVNTAKLSLQWSYVSRTLQIELLMERAGSRRGKMWSRNVCLTSPGIFNVTFFMRTLWYIVS